MTIQTFEALIKKHFYRLNLVANIDRVIAYLHGNVESHPPTQIEAQSVVIAREVVADASPAQLARGIKAARQKLENPHDNSIGHKTPSSD
jgi:hypothetical protein